MSFDYAIHSDFLIHWTGEDIDKRDKDKKPKWGNLGKDKSKTTLRETESYIKRLYDILQFGLWMTEETREEDEESLCLGGKPVPIPKTPKTCFTELKLSESRKHARHYGRLGIGVKRPFLFDRYGRPLIYYLRKQLDNDILLKDCVSNLEDKKLLNFFKPMNRSGNPLTYDLYAESEWRILFSRELLRNGLIRDPRGKYKGYGTFFLKIAVIRRIINYYAWIKKITRRGKTKEVRYFFL